MYRIAKTFSFAAAHQLSQLPEDHKCHRLHGHNYTATVVLERDHLDSAGFVVDYGLLLDVKQYLDEHLDHRNLSDLFEWPVTAERLASYLYSIIKPWHDPLREVIVCETPATSASYRP